MKHFEAIAVRLMVLAVGVTLSACGGGHGGGGGATTLSTTAYPRFAYVANYSDNSVSSYVVDATTGRLKDTGKVAAGLTRHPLPPLALGSNPEPLQPRQAAQAA